MKSFLSFALCLAIFSGCSYKSPDIADTGTTINAGNDELVKGLGDDTIDAGIDSMQGYDSSSESFGSDEERLSSINSQLQSIYFGTDRYDISATEAEKIDTDANILNSAVASNLNVVVEGNCDEWGTDEYNYALGLKRAKSVKNSLATAGVDVGRISIISYGESKPKCSDHNAECWQENRRADIKVR